MFQRTRMSHTQTPDAKRQTIVLATRNPKKLRELRRLLRDLDIHWLSLRDFPDAPAVREDGHTFATNARKKAVTATRATGLIAVADDSGLEVDALGGAPGVRSARYAGAQANDAANNRKLLRALRQVPSHRRGAQFRCVIAVATPAGRVVTVEGRVRGRMAARVRGRSGFGYDPLFLMPRYGRTFAELGPRLKDRLSHRAQAARRARPVIQDLLRHAVREQARGVGWRAPRTRTRKRRPAARACR